MAVSPSAPELGCGELLVLVLLLSLGDLGCGQETSTARMGSNVSGGVYDDGRAVSDDGAGASSHEPRAVACPRSSVRGGLTAARDEDGAGAGPRVEVGDGARTPDARPCPEAAPFVCPRAGASGFECRERPCPPSCARVACPASMECVDCGGGAECVPRGARCQ